MELNFAHERIPTGVEEISLACDLLGGDIRRLYPRRYDRFSPFRETVHTDAAFPYVAGSWAFLWVVYFVRICAFNCPRCGKCFIGRWWFGNFFLFRQCAHCGLPRDPNALAVFPSRR